MPCDTRRPAGITPAQRVAQIRDALKALEKALRERSAKIEIGPQGAIMFNGKGWEGDVRGDVTDVCAYRRLSAAGSFELKQAIQRAEAASGRKVNEQAIAAGVHSHDGKTWGKH